MSNSNRINELNAQALSQSLNELRATYDARIKILENKLATIEDLLKKQNRVLGEALQMAYGKGSTVREE
jgi:LPS O-antigen subunit length determinant protein (WzzB/FepE family)